MLGIKNAHRHPYEHLIYKYLGLIFYPSKPPVTN